MRYSFILLEAEGKVAFPLNFSHQPKFVSKGSYLGSNPNYRPTREDRMGFNSFLMYAQRYKQINEPFLSTVKEIESYGTSSSLLLASCEFSLLFFSKGLGWQGSFAIK